jgi:Outer membrane protein and related peptidoglycan-associated (lipo)proteins
MDALASNRDAKPEACAKAQVMFDRHVVDEAYTKSDLEPAAEYKIFEEALAACGGPAIAAIDAYTIYFGFDRYNLTDAAKRVIDNVAGLAGGRGVNVYGYTDTAGSAAYNEGLSKRRADSVAKALRDAGVQVVAEIPEGETNLAVQTGDGVAEPLNRRAIVKFR